MPNNQMPHNLEAESALLGCILIDGDIQSELLETLREDDFYQESHKEILAAMKAVYGGRKPVAFYGRTGGNVPDEKEIIEAALRALEAKA